LEIVPAFLPAITCPLHLSVKTPAPEPFVARQPAVRPTLPDFQRNKELALAKGWETSGVTFQLQRPSSIRQDTWCCPHPGLFEGELKSHASGPELSLTEWNLSRQEINEDPLLAPRERALPGT